MLFQILNNVALLDTANLLYDINNFKPPKDWNNTYTKNILTDTIIEKKPNFLHRMRKIKTHRVTRINQSKQNMTNFETNKPTKPKPTDLKDQCQKRTVLNPKEYAAYLNRLEVYIQSFISQKNQSPCIFDLSQVEQHDQFEYHGFCCCSWFLIFGAGLGSRGSVNTRQPTHSWLTHLKINI